jgi:hypothetical protein
MLDWVKHLWFLTKIYRDVAEATETETIEEQIFEQNYLYLKQLFDQRFPDKALELQQRLSHKAKT